MHKKHKDAGDSKVVARNLVAQEIVDKIESILKDSGVMVFDSGDGLRYEFDDQFFNQYPDYNSWSNGDDYADYDRYDYDADWRAYWENNGVNPY